MTCKVMLYVLDTSFRLMNPLMPFLSETLYRALPGKSKTRLDHTTFPEPTEVYCVTMLIIYKSIF